MQCTRRYNEKRVQVLGRDLGAAHFLVARKGKIRFMGHKDWITSYRKDAKAGDDELDLPVMTHDLCTLPVAYDPNFRIEAIDASGIPLRYEGLSNFGKNLLYLHFTLSFIIMPRNAFKSFHSSCMKLESLYFLYSKLTLCKMVEFPRLSSIE